MSGWIGKVIESLGYPGIALLMVAENLFPPIPSELIVPLAGYAAARGSFSFAGVVAAATLGSILGALPLYYAGRTLGEGRVRALAQAHGRWFAVSEEDVERARIWILRHRLWAVLLSRLVPAVRSLISVPAGVAGLPMGPFLLMTAIGSAVWNAALAGAGFLLLDQFTIVERHLEMVTNVVLGVMLAAYLAQVVRYRKRCAR